MRKMILLMTAVATVAMFAGVTEAEAARHYRGSYRSPGVRYNYNYRGNVRAPQVRQFHRQLNRQLNRGYRYNNGYRGYSPYYRGGRYYRNNGFGVQTPGFQFYYGR